MGHGGRPTAPAWPSSPATDRTGSASSRWMGMLAVLSEPIEGATSLYPVWAPDGTSLLVWRESDGALLSMDATTGALTQTGLTSSDWPTWRRSAP